MCRFDRVKKGSGDCSLPQDWGLRSPSIIVVNISGNIRVLSLGQPLECERVENFVQLHQGRLGRLLRRTAQEGLQFLRVNFFSQLGALDGFECICIDFLSLLLFGPLLLNFVSFFIGLCLLLLKPSCVVLNPDVLLDLSLFLIENELINFFRVDIISFFLDVQNFVLALAFLVHLFGVETVFFIIGVAVFLVSLSGLQKFSFHTSDLFLKNLFGNVEVFLKLFPGNLIHLLLVRKSRQLLLNLFPVLFLQTSLPSFLKGGRIHGLALVVIILHPLKLLLGQFGDTGFLELLQSSPDGLVTDKDSFADVGS